MSVYWNSGKFQEHYFQLFKAITLQEHDLHMIK